MDATMNLEKVIFGFFIVLALTLNFAFFIGDMTNPLYHNTFILFAALVVSLITTILKFGDSLHMGAIFFATSLVADIQLLVAAIIWGWAAHISVDGVTPAAMVTVVSVSGGALLANIVSVVLLVAETLSIRR